MDRTLLPEGHRHTELDELDFLFAQWPGFGDDVPDVLVGAGQLRKLLFELPVTVGQLFQGEAPPLEAVLRGRDANVGARRSPRLQPALLARGDITNAMMSSSVFNTLSKKRAKNVVLARPRLDKVGRRSA